MKILLIDPPFYRIFGFYNRYFPLGVVTIGTVLKEAGYDVAVYDADCNDNARAIDYTRLAEYYKQYLDSFENKEHPVWAEVRETIMNFAPDIVAISAWTTYMASSFHVAIISKELNPHCHVIMGGPHATVKAEEILKISPSVDYVIRGEGELVAIELVEQLDAGRFKPELIAGLSFRKNGDICHNATGENHKNLDIFPFPDRNLLLNEDKYSSEDMGLIMTSRGCPYSCSYCATQTNRVSYRSVEHILNEIRFLKSKYGTTQISFKDDSFTVNKKRVEMLCDSIIREKLGVIWECNTRANLITSELLDKMKKAGCNSIKVGIESGSSRILKAMNKGITHNQVRNVAKLFKKSGIHWTGYFMMGVPGETVEDVHKTLQLMYEVQPDFASIGVYEPFPGTAMFAEGVNKGLVKPEMTFSDFYTTLPNHYYKVDAQRQVDTIEPHRFFVLEQEIKKKFHRYNKTFSSLLNRIRSRARLYARKPWILFVDFKKYLSWR